MLGKNPISALNELRLKEQYYVVGQKGPPKNRSFTVCVRVDGHCYYGFGKSLKSAKIEAASRAIQSFTQTLNNSINISQNTTPGRIYSTSGKFRLNKYFISNSFVKRHIL